jgi:hypothetical protein
MPSSSFGACEVQDDIDRVDMLILDENIYLHDSARSAVSPGLCREAPASSSIMQIIMEVTVAATPA